MGYIYGIRNKINNKWYVGQSIYFPTERWRQERVGYAAHNMAISHAIKKYGIENFEFLILEEVVDNKLNEREIYWIEQKNSYIAGYNSTRGGTNSWMGYRLRNRPEEIANYYIAYPKLSCRDVAKYFNIFHETVSAILNKYKIPIRRGKNPIKLINKNKEEFIFDCYTAAAKFLVENSYVKVKVEQLRKNILPYKDSVGDFKIIRG